jgi:hypothetical protein
MRWCATALTQGHFAHMAYRESLSWKDATGLTARLQGFDLLDDIRILAQLLQQTDLSDTRTRYTLILCL